MKPGRLALVAILYPAAFWLSVRIAERSLSAEDEGPVELVLLFVVMFALGAFARTWLAVFVPLGWAGVAYAAGIAVPLENVDDPDAGRELFALIVAAGIVPMSLGVVVALLVRRLRSP